MNSVQGTILPTCETLGDLDGSWESPSPPEVPHVLGDHQGLTLGSDHFREASVGLAWPSFTSWEDNASGTNLDLSERQVDPRPLFVESFLVVLKLVGSQPLEELTKATAPVRTHHRKARVCTRILNVHTARGHHPGTPPPALRVPFRPSQVESPPPLQPLPSCHLHFPSGTPALSPFTGDN